MKRIKITEQITQRDTPAIDKYLREIAKFKMLTPEQEVLLARKIHKGDRKALETLVNANLRFVVSVAKQHQCPGFQLLDLINEGNLGLIRAAERFDETRGFKFISYAVWWIRQSILQALDERSRMVRVPLNKIVYTSKIHKVFVKLEQDYQREPVAEEVAELLHLNPEFVTDALNSSSVHLSLDGSLNEDHDYIIYETLNNTIPGEQDHKLDNDSLKTDIKRMLNSLKKSESLVLMNYFGLNGTPSHTLHEVGEALDFSHERVRQLKERALNKLQNSHWNVLLKSYLG